MCPDMSDRMMASEQEVPDMVRERLEVRLDPERRRKLAKIAEERGAPVSEVVRGLIDYGYEEVMKERRRRAVEVICSMEVEDSHATPGDQAHRVCGPRLRCSPGGRTDRPGGGRSSRG